MTIIVLLILAGISIQMLTGDNGILTRAGEAKERTERARIIEQIKLDILSKIADNNGEDITEEQFIDALNNYFNNVPDELPDDLSELDLISINEGYTINAKDIYDGKIKKIRKENLILTRDNSYIIGFNAETGTELNIPSTVTYNEIIYTITGVGDGAFAGRTNLQKVTFSDTIESIGGAAFDSCSNLKTIIWGNNIKEIKYNAFARCTSLSEINFPESITSLGGMCAMVALN